MARLSATILALMAAGQPLRQSWLTSTPINSAHAAYVDFTIDKGIFPVRSIDTFQRVIGPGNRRNDVMNPHPRKVDKPKAFQYKFEVDNRDGYFFMGAGNAWNPLSLYDAEPQECRVKHQLSIYDPSTDSWLGIAHMEYTGRVLHIEYVDGQNAAGDIVPISAVIFTEALAVEGILNHVYTQDDADDEIIDDPAGLGQFSFTT